MAKMLSHVGSSIRGSVGGLTYSANQYSPIVLRARVSPVNPNTTKQTAIRSAFANASTLWVGLTQAQRDAWDDYASTLVFSGPQGSYSVPGRLVFIGNLATAQFLKDETGSPAVVATTAPSSPGFLNVGGVLPTPNVTPATTGILIAYQNDEAFSVVGYTERSVSFNQTRNRFKGPFLSAQQISSVTIAGAAGTLGFSGLVADLVYFTNPRFISAQAPFKLSAPSFLRHIANTVV